MTAMSDYLEAKLGDHVLRVAAYTQPTGLYLALFTTATDDTTGGTEVTGGSYARQSMTFGSYVANTGAKNSASINFPNMPAVTVSHAAIHDAVTAGNRLFHGALTSSVVVTAGQTLTFQINDITVTLS